MSKLLDVERVATTRDARGYSAMTTALFDSQAQPEAAAWQTVSRDMPFNAMSDGAVSATVVRWLRYPLWQAGPCKACD
jgi:hypothetical protein